MPLSEPLRLKLLWLFLAVSAFAAIEPSPYEAMFFVCLRRVRARRPDLRRDAGAADRLPVGVQRGRADRADPLHRRIARASVFTFVTIYISLTTILFAALVAAQSASQRMKAIRSGYTFAGVLAAMLGLLGYFNVAGLSPYFTMYDGQRADGAVQGPQRVRAVPGRADRLGLPGSAAAARARSCAAWRCCW